MPYALRLTEQYRWLKCVKSAIPPCYSQKDPASLNIASSIFFDEKLSIFFFFLNKLPFPAECDFPVTPSASSHFFQACFFFLTLYDANTWRYTKICWVFFWGEGGLFPLKALWRETLFGLCFLEVITPSQSDVSCSPNDTTSANFLKRFSKWHKIVPFHLLYVCSMAILKSDTHLSLTPLPISLREIDLFPVGTTLRSVSHFFFFSFSL